MTDLREQITEALGRHHPDGGSCTCNRCTDDIRRVVAVVQPEIDRLRGDVARAKDALGLVKARIPAGSPHRLRNRLREAEAVIKRVSAHLAEYETGDWGARGTLAKIRAEITPTIEALDQRTINSELKVQPGDQTKEPT